MEGWLSLLEPPASSSWVCRPVEPSSTRRVRPVSLQVPTPPQRLSPRLTSGASSPCRDAGLREAGWPGLGPLPGHQCGAQNRLSKQASPWAGISGCCRLPPAPTPTPDLASFPSQHSTQPPTPHSHPRSQMSGGGVEQTNLGPDTGRGTPWSGPTASSYLSHYPVLCRAWLVEFGRMGTCVGDGASG